jgi:hypothetical protein
VSSRDPISIRLKIYVNFVNIKQLLCEANSNVMKYNIVDVRACTRNVVVKQRLALSSLTIKFRIKSIIYEVLPVSVVDLTVANGV